MAAGIEFVYSPSVARHDYPSNPFWSPDSRSIGFFAEGKLKRIDIAGGGVRTLASCGSCLGGAWNSAGLILFTVGGSLELFKVPATGGEPVRVTQRQSGESGHSSPQFLPDGRHFLYYVGGGPEIRGEYVGQFDGSERQRL